MGEDACKRISRARRGDVEAFTTLVHEHQDSIYRLAVRMVGFDQAEDVAQQAFVKAWLGLNSFQGTSAFGTWLYRITMNLCLDHLRRSNRFQPVPLDDVESSLPSTDDVAEQVATAAELASRREALTWAIERTPTEDRLLLNLRVGENRSYESIAEILQINPITVGTRLYRARARLQLVDWRLEEVEHGVR